MLDRDGAAARRHILYISRGVVRTTLHGVQGAARELLERGRLLADRAAAAAPRRRRINTRNAEADAAAARRRGAVAFDLALPAREAGLAEQLWLRFWCGFAHDLRLPADCFSVESSVNVDTMAMTNQSFGCLAMRSCFPQCRDRPEELMVTMRWLDCQSRLLLSRRSAQGLAVCKTLAKVSK